MLCAEATVSGGVASQPPPVLQSISFRVASHHYTLHKRGAVDRYCGQVADKLVQSLVALAGIYAGTQPLGVHTLSIGGRAKEFEQAFRQVQPSAASLRQGCLGLCQEGSPKTVKSTPYCRTIFTLACRSDAPTLRLEIRFFSSPELFMAVSQGIRCPTSTYTDLSSTDASLHLLGTDGNRCRKYCWGL